MNLNNEFEKENEKTTNITNTPIQSYLNIVFNEELENYIEYLNNNENNINFTSIEKFIHSTNKILTEYLNNNDFKINISSKNNINDEKEIIISTTFKNDQKTANQIKKLNIFLDDKMKKVMLESDEKANYEELELEEKENQIKYNFAKILNKNIQTNNEKMFKTFLLNINIDKNNFKEKLFNIGIINYSNEIKKDIDKLNIDDVDYDNDKKEYEEKLEELNNLQIEDYLDQLEEIEKIFFDKIILNFNERFFIEINELFYKFVENNLHLNDKNNKFYKKENISGLFNILNKAFKEINQFTFERMELKKIIDDYNETSKFKLDTKSFETRFKEKYADKFYHFPLIINPFVKSKKNDLETNNNEDIKPIFINNSKDFYTLRLNFKFKENLTSIFSNNEKYKYHLNQIFNYNEKNLVQWKDLNNIIDFAIFYTKKPLTFIKEYLENIKNNNLLNFKNNFDGYNDLYVFLFIENNSKFIYRKQNGFYIHLIRNFFLSINNKEERKNLYLNIKRIQDKNDLLYIDDVSNTSFELFNIKQFKKSKSSIDFDIFDKEIELNINKYIKQNIKMNVEIKFEIENLQNETNEQTFYRDFIKKKKVKIIKNKFHFKNFAQNLNYSSTSDNEKAKNIYQNKIFLFYIQNLILFNSIHQNLNKKKDYIIFNEYIKPQEFLKENKDLEDVYKNIILSIVNLSNQNDLYSIAINLDKKETEIDNILNNQDDNIDINKKLKNINTNLYNDEHNIENINISKDENTIILFLKEIITDQNLDKKETQIDNKYVFGEIFVLYNNIFKKEKSIYVKIDSIKNILGAEIKKIIQYYSEEQNINFNNLVYLAHLDKEQFNLNDFYNKEGHSIYSKVFLNFINEKLNQNQNMIKIFPFLFNFYYVNKINELETELIISNLNKIETFNEESISPIFGLFNSKKNYNNYLSNFEKMYTFNLLKEKNNDNENNTNKQKKKINYKVDDLNDNDKNFIEQVFLIYNGTRNYIDNNHYHLYKYFFQLEKNIKIENKYKILLNPFGQTIINIINSK